MAVAAAAAIVEVVVDVVVGVEATMAAVDNK